jgi:1-deoxy-D-xylulose-5-phosphate reductoisomerase
MSPILVRSVTVLGSTGSVGTQTIELLAGELLAGEPHRFRVRALVAGRNAALLAEQAIALNAEHAVISDPARYQELRQALAGTDVTVAAGPDAVVEAAALAVDWTMAAITGAVGLASTLAAIRGGGVVALANKEALVCAGEVMLRAVKAAGATLLPVDSEHNAIFQSLADGNRGAVEKIVLTASGGPFRTASMEDMAKATPEAALKHPIWSMGAKISIDSATLMNKGLEVIEAHWLFGLGREQVDVVIHPQSVVHSMVELVDGSVIAQLGQTDMRLPIQYAFSCPDRWSAPLPSLDLARVGRLDFEAPDTEAFPCLALAYRALEQGPSFPVVLNAANEVAVRLFLDGQLGFTAIADVIAGTMDAHRAVEVRTLAEVRAVDRWARDCSSEIAHGLESKVRS